MFRRSLIDLVFPDDDETFRLHMDFYVVVMAQMVAGSLLVTVPAMSRAIEAGSPWKPPRAQPIVSTISRFACSTTSGGRSS